MTYPTPDTAFPRTASVVYRDAAATGGNLARCAADDGSLRA